MGLFDKFWAWAGGYDEANAEDARQADLSQRAYLTEKYGPGTSAYSPEKWRQILVDYARQDGKPDNYYILLWNQQKFVTGQDSYFNTATQQAEIGGAASQGASTIWDWLTAILKTIFGALPWWLWAGFIALVFWWLGGFSLLRGVLRKR